MEKPLPGPRQLDVAIPSPVISQSDKGFCLEVFTSQQVAACEMAAFRESSLVITDTASLAAGNVLAGELAAAEKEIEARAKALKAPFKQTIDSIHEIRTALLSTILPAKQSIQGKLLAFKRKKDAEEAEAQRAAEEERQKALAAAEAERKRLQAEADAKHAEAVRAAREKAEAEAKEMAALIGAPVEPEPVKVAPAPVVAAPEIPLSTRTLMPAAAPVEVAVTTRKDKKPEIYDLRALCRYVADGGALDLVQANTTAVKNALVSNAQLPGCRMIEVETPVMKAAR